MSARTIQAVTVEQWDALLKDRAELATALQNTNAILAAVVYDLSNKSVSRKYGNGERLRIRGLADAAQLTLDVNRATLAKAAL